MTRRSRGEGGVHRRKDGRWQLTFIGLSSRLQTIYAPKTATRREANEKLATAIRARDLGLVGPDQTLADYLASWLARADHVKAITRTRYEGIIRLHVLPAIGAVELRRLTPQHLSDLYASLRATQSPSSIRQLHTVLRSSLEQAVLWQLIARNPAAAVRPPKVARREMAILTMPQVRHFLEAIVGDEYEALYVLALHTGARQGELLALRWCDIDAGSISISATLTLGQRLPPKTASSVRIVPLTDEAQRVLRVHRRKMSERLLPMQGRTEGEQFVFLTPLGEPVNGWHVTERNLKPLLTAAGLPTIRFHDLRHQAASIMLSNGVPVHVVSKILGHSSATTTLNTYAHLIPGDVQAATATIERALVG